jgi:mRNA-degrading endonuclease toxin of MazEF toxin-antitoxin module
MRRGEIWTVSGGKDYAGKPRPAVILQDDRFDGTASITICAFTTDETEAPLFRLPVEPNERNGLRDLPSYGRQDNHCSEIQDWQTRRKLRRGRYPAAQSGGVRFSRIGGFLQKKPRARPTPKAEIELKRGV